MENILKSIGLVMVVVAMLTVMALAAVWAMDRTYENHCQTWNSCDAEAQQKLK